MLGQANRHVIGLPKNKVIVKYLQGKTHYVDTSFHLLQIFPEAFLATSRIRSHIVNFSSKINPCQSELKKFYKNTYPKREIGMDRFGDYISSIHFFCTKRAVECLLVLDLEYQLPPSGYS